PDPARACPVRSAIRCAPSGVSTTLTPWLVFCSEAVGGCDATLPLLEQPATVAVSAAAARTAAAAQARGGPAVRLGMGPPRIRLVMSPPRIRRRPAAGYRRVAPHPSRQTGAAIRHGSHPRYPERERAQRPPPRSWPDGRRRPRREAGCPAP